MTVKEVFDLRKQGRIEEAYEAIRPMYAAHRGRYTTLCMFWTAADVFKLRLDQKRYDEAEKILEALKRMLPRVEAITKELDTQNATSKKEESKYPWEKKGTQQEGSSAAAFIASATRHLAKATQKLEKKKFPQTRRSSERKGNKFSFPSEKEVDEVKLRISQISCRRQKIFLRYQRFQRDKKKKPSACRKKEPPQATIRQIRTIRVQI